MRQPLRILHLEDSPRDAEIVGDVLGAAGVQGEIFRVADAGQFRDALEHQVFDVILCDHNIPGYDGLSALELARNRQPVTPVLMVSGSLGEEEAIRCLHAGAADYLLKDRLQRLGSAVTRAVEHAEAVKREMSETRARREVELLFSRFAAQSEDIFWFMGLNPERILYVSPAVAKTWGTPPEEYYTAPRLWMDAIHPDDRARVLAAFEEFVHGRGEFWLEYRVNRPDGAERLVVDRGTLIRNERGDITGASGIARDVTERRKLEQQYQQAQKMEAIGRLAAGIAHDFNNSLTAISGFAEFAGMHLEPDHPSQADLREVRKAVESASRLTRQLLAFSRKQTIQPVVMDLNAAIHNNARMTHRMIGEDVEFVNNAGAAPLMIRADPGQIEQVLMNLAVNARDAMPRGGTFTIGTAVERVGANGRMDGQLAPGPYAKLIVRDTGHGMPPDVAARVFEPFFTTKADKGTGLGLATVYGIVSQSGGDIRIWSEPGRGTEFTIRLPLESGTESS